MTKEEIIDVIIKALDVDLDRLFRNIDNWEKPSDCIVNFDCYSLAEAERIKSIWDKFCTLCNRENEKREIYKFENRAGTFTYRFCLKKDLKNANLTQMVAIQRSKTMTEELKQKAEEWRKNYKPMGITSIERDCVVVETQAKPTKIIENPNPFRIKDGWYDLYLKDLENAYIAGAKELEKENTALRQDRDVMKSTITDYDNFLTKAMKHLKDLVYVVKLGKNELATARVLAEVQQFLEEIDL